MPMFIQTFGVDETNRHLHLDYIETANSLAYQFNSCHIDEPSSFVYNPNLKRVQLHTEFDLKPENSKVIAQQINWILEFEEIYGKEDKDLFLIEYLKKVQNITFKEIDRELFIKLFSKLNLEDYFGKISANFLKDKINSWLII